MKGELHTEEEAKTFLKENLTCAFFKAGSCHKTMQGWGYVQEALSKYPDLSVGIVRVVESRPASNLIAEETGIKHESPQFILIKEGKPVFDVDNWEISLQGVTEALQQHIGVGQDNSDLMEEDGELDIYIDLLESYVDGELEERDFSHNWLEVFRDDASLRSRDEFKLLNSLFGDVDATLASGIETTVGLKKKAEELLQKLS